LQAIVTLKFVLEKQAHHMLHRMHTLSSQEKVVSMVLLATFTWKETIFEVNAVNVVFGLKEVSTSNSNKIWKLNFPQYKAKKPGDNFVLCDKCNRLQSLKRGAYIVLQRKWIHLLEKHLATTKSHQDQYYTN